MLAVSIRGHFGYGHGEQQSYRRGENGGWDRLAL